MIDRRSLLMLSSAITVLPRAVWATGTAGRGESEFLPFAAALAPCFVDLTSGDPTHVESKLPTAEALGRAVMVQMDGQPADVREPLYLGLRLLQYSTPLVGAWGAFEHLPLADRRKLVARWGRIWLTPIQSLYMAMRSAYLFNWYADSRNWSAVGYEGPWVGIDGPTGQLR